MRFLLRKNVWFGLAAGLGVSGAASATLAVDSQDAAKSAGAKQTPDARWRAVVKSSEGKRLESGEPGVRLSRKIVSSADRSDLGLRLYQYSACPYCCKVRAFLDYYGFSYEVVEVHPLFRRELNFAGGYKKVPVLRTACCEKPLKDSSLIISVLATFLTTNMPFIKIPEMYNVEMEKLDDGKEAKKQITLNLYFIMYGDTPLDNSQIQRAREEREWRQWVDDKFIHLISPNVYRTVGDAYNTFEWFSEFGEWRDNFSAWERAVAKHAGALVMYAITPRLLKRHGIKKGEERQAMREAIHEWFDAMGPHRAFMGGQEPGLADLAFYGACTSFTGCLAFTEMYSEIGQFREWYDAMEKAVREGRGRALLERKKQNQLGAETGQEKEKKQRGRPS